MMFRNEVAKCLLFQAGKPKSGRVPFERRFTAYPFDAITYRRRNIIERTFCRLKDFRRLATRYDRLDETFVSTLCIAAALAYFLK